LSNFVASAVFGSEMADSSAPLLLRDLWLPDCAIDDPPSASSLVRFRFLDDEVEVATFLATAGLDAVTAGVKVHSGKGEAPEDSVKPEPSKPR
jgi:hypothetical protein